LGDVSGKEIKNELGIAERLPKTRGGSAFQWKCHKILDLGGRIYIPTLVVTPRNAVRAKWKKWEMTSEIKG